MTGETYENLRKRALMRRSADLGLRRAPGRPVWGVVMEMGETDGVTTVVATDDGAASLLASTGGSVHLTRDDWPNSAGSRLIGSAGDFMLECSPAWAYPLPENGMIRFYLLTFDGIMTTEAPMKDLASDRLPLSSLFYAGHDVYVLTRLVGEDPNWMSYKPVNGHAAALPKLSAEVPPEVPAKIPAEVPAAAELGPSAAPGQATPATQTAVEPSGDGTPSAQGSPTCGSGSDPVLLAAAQNDVDELAILLAQGYECVPNAKGITPLMAAAHAGALEPLRLLLAAGVPVDVQDGHGYTALMLACNAGHDVCARLLLGAGADVNRRDSEGFTSLMFAAKHGRSDIIRLLIERGADPSATTEDGLSAVSLATQKGHTQAASILRGE